MSTIGILFEFCPPPSSLSERISLIGSLHWDRRSSLEFGWRQRLPGNSVAVNSVSDSHNRGLNGLKQYDLR
jgi:hypothetical protein